jgi:hypothetical protein
MTYTVVIEYVIRKIKKTKMNWTFWVSVNTFAPIYDHGQIALFCPSSHIQL